MCEGYRHCTHQCPSIKCSACEELWYYNFQCLSKSPNANMLASKDMLVFKNTSDVETVSIELAIGS